MSRDVSRSDFESRRLSVFGNPRVACSRIESSVDSACEREIAEYLSVKLLIVRILRAEQIKFKLFERAEKHGYLHRRALSFVYRHIGESEDVFALGYLLDRKRLSVRGHGDSARLATVIAVRKSVFFAAGERKISAETDVLGNLRSARLYAVNAVVHTVICQSRAARRRAFKPADLAEIHIEFSFDSAYDNAFARTSARAVRCGIGNAVIAFFGENGISVVP